MPFALNTLTGVVDFQPDHVVNHLVVGQYLKEVPEGTKSLVPGMFTPGTVEEYDAAHPDGASVVEEPAAEELVIVPPADETPAGDVLADGTPIHDEDVTDV